MKRRYFVGSYGPRYGDPLETFIGFHYSAVAECLEDACSKERDYGRNMCHIDHDADDTIYEDECENCDPPLAIWGPFDESDPIAMGICTGRELLEAWHQSLRHGYVHSLPLRY